MSWTTVGIVSPGAMGSAIGDVLRRGGARVVATLDGRSARTRTLSARAELDLMPDLAAVVAASDVLLSIAPPGSAGDIAADIAGACRRGGVRPLVADLNAIAPSTVELVAATLAEAGVGLVDGSISGPPPWRPDTTRLYLSGPRAAELAALPMPGLAVAALGDRLGKASALKMCTASVYKGTAALLAHALLTASAAGVLDEVLADLAEGLPGLTDRVERWLASSTAKSARYVDEMHEIAATQRSAGLPGDLFEGIATVYASLSGTRLAAQPPEAAGDGLDLRGVLAAMTRATDDRS